MADKRKPRRLLCFQRQRRSSSQIAPASQIIVFACISDSSTIQHSGQIAGLLKLLIQAHVYEWTQLKSDFYYSTKHIWHFIQAYW